MEGGGGVKSDGGDGSDKGGGVVGDGGERGRHVHQTV